MPRSRVSLSKSRFCYGLQCLRQLWWRVHEPDAPELVAPPGLQAVFARGHRVGELAQAEFPGGVLVDREYWQTAEKIADTQAALAARAPAVYEASFSADDVFVAVDVLARRRGGHALVEVKSTLEVKEQYIPDLAIQLHVLRASGLNVRRAEVMHLNRACRFPDLSNLFVREDVTEAAEELLQEIPRQLRRMRKALDRELPASEPGPHCTTPYECPFVDRCCSPLPDDHVSTLYKAARCASTLLADGVESIRDIPENFELPAIAARQARATKSGKLVVEDGLGDALAAFEAPIAFLDFETINPAVPVWNGCGPYQHVPVQVSCHRVGARGALRHHAFLAEGASDPRPAIAEAVLEACGDAATVVAYNDAFERRCLEHLAEHVPTRRKALQSVGARLVDLLPIVRDHVYHPRFGASFSMKAVAPALVKGLGYDGLAVGEGGTASAVLETLLLGNDALSPGERDTMRAQFLEYCAQDTLAMVKVTDRLRELGLDELGTSAPVDPRCRAVRGRLLRCRSSGSACTTRAE
jgi:predicted RecB family nuclease